MKLKYTAVSLVTALVVAAASSAASGYADGSFAAPAQVSAENLAAKAVTAVNRTPAPETTVTTAVSAKRPPAVTSAPKAQPPEGSVTVTSVTEAPPTETTVTSTVTEVDGKPVPPHEETSATTAVTTLPPMTTTVPTTTTTRVPITAPASTELTQAYFLGGSLMLKWKPVSCDGYSVYYRVRGTDKWSTASVSGGETASFTLAGLAADTCYQLAVRPYRTDYDGTALSSELSSVKEAVNHVPVNYTTVKGLWIPCFSLQTMIQGKTASQFTNNFSTACQNAKNMGVNTLYVHVRVFSDALYQSDIYPWSRYCTGKAGVSPGYDPLKIMTDTAHKYGLSIQAWINPYRAETPYNLSNSLKFSTVGQWYANPAYYKQYVSYSEDYMTCWLNPGYPAVRDMICKGAEEIMTRYAVDGLHIDDYFYPTTDASFDSYPYSAYGGGMSLSDWRLSNCTATVKGLYNTVKAANPAALFGIAPQGNYENNYNYMYADVALWTANSGYCDYIAPQVYFGYENQYKPFKETIKFWLSLPRASTVKMYIGIAPANLWLKSEFEDNTGIIGSQIKDSFSAGAGGVILYSYESLFTPPSGKQKRASDEINAIKSALK